MTDYSNKTFAELCKMLEMLESEASHMRAQSIRFDGERQVAEKALARAGYTRCDGELGWKPPLGKKPASLSLPRFTLGNSGLHQADDGRWLYYGDLIRHERGEAVPAPTQTPGPSPREAARQILAENGWSKPGVEALLNAFDAYFNFKEAQCHAQHLGQDSGYGPRYDPHRVALVIGLSRCTRNEGDSMDRITEEEARAMFLMIGLPALKVWRLPNQYFKYQEGESRETTEREAVYRESRPSWLVKTAAGLIQLNLRKRVVEVDWSDTGLAVKPGEKDDVTKTEFYIHAYTKLKALEYLADIANAYHTALVLANREQEARQPGGQRGDK